MERTVPVHLNGCLPFCSTVEVKGANQSGVHRLTTPLGQRLLRFVPPTVTRPRLNTMLG